MSFPDNTIINATHTTILDIPWLPLTTRQVYIFPDLTYRALVSVAQFCDNNYNVVFTPSHVYILYTNNIVLTGTRVQPHGI